MTMDILHPQFPEYRPSADNTSSSRKERGSKHARATGTDDLAPARFRTTAIDNGEDAERQAAAVAEIIRDRQASGFYHRPEVLREIAARLLASPELDEGLINEA